MCTTPINNFYFNPELILQVVEDIINQLKLKKLKKFKTSCFRSNLYYDIVYQDALEHSYSHLKKFVVKHLPPEDDLKPVSVGQFIVGFKIFVSLKFVQFSLEFRK